MAFADHLHGCLLRDGLGPLNEMDPPDAVALIYVHMADTLASNVGRVLPILERKLADPYLLTDETFGTGASAEAGQAAMMEAFPAETRPLQPRKAPSDGSRQG